MGVILPRITNALVVEAAAGLNAPLHAGTREAPQLELHAGARGDLDDARRAIRDRCTRDLLLHAEGPAVLPQPDECLVKVLKSRDTFLVEPRVAAVLFDADTVNVIHAEHKTVDLLPLLDASAGHYADNYDALVVKDKLPLDSDDSRIYSDPVLRGRRNLLGLILRLNKCWLTCFRSYRGGRAGVFTVGKKDGELRLGFDARRPNECFYSPPKSSPSTFSAIVAVRLHSTCRAGNAVDLRRPNQVRIVAIDYTDSFYLFI